MYDIFLLPPAQKNLDDLEHGAFERILKKIRALSQTPRPSGCLRLTAEGGYRIRVGDYRILYRIDDSARRIYVYRIKHRKDAYS